MTPSTAARRDDDEPPAGPVVTPEAKGRPLLADIDEDSRGESGRRFFELVERYIERASRGEGAVSTTLPMPAIARRFDEPLPRTGMGLADVVARVERDILADANRLMHPMAMGHQVSPPLPAAIWMDAVISALNQSLAVAEMSPSATAVETQVIRWMTSEIGWPLDGGTRPGGTSTSGGTEATFTALLAARARSLPDAWRDGVGDDPPVVLCGEHAHYAITRAVAELGLGVRRAIAIPSRGVRIDPNALAERLDALRAAGTRVMAVVATAGYTATGAFDPLEAIGAICAARCVWLHVDGAHGASALLSSTRRHFLRGIERADSVAWDPHKMMLMPLGTGMLLVRDERSLEGAFAQHAPYLFHSASASGDEAGDEAGAGPGDGPEREAPLPLGWDQGTRSFLCSRRADALRVWVALQRYGADGFGALYDHLCDTAGALHAMITGSTDFEALHEPESNILCFRYRGEGDGRDDETLDALNLALRERYNRSGAGWITTTVLGGRRVLRVTIMNPRTGRVHLARMLDGLRRIAAEPAELAE